MFEEVTGTLSTGDLFIHAGNGEARESAFATSEARESAFATKSPALTAESIVPAAIQTEEAFRSTSLAPNIGRTIRKLAALELQRLAVMHGSCFECSSPASAGEGTMPAKHAPACSP
ncbi:MAG TPA: hypothetical protein VHU18_02360 [Rhizomicrobium sp.]|jgi:hypothetical protein|nr:hypothetical protein [Rhizomicrobium sp.]